MKLPDIANSRQQRKDALIEGASITDDHVDGIIKYSGDDSPEYRRYLKYLQTHNSALFHKIHSLA